MSERLSNSELKRWAAVRADDAGRLSREVLALRARVAKLEAVIQTQNGVVVSGTLKLNEARVRVAKLETALADACRVRDEWCDAYTKLRDEMRARVAKLEAELEAYRDAVRVDAQMDGPKFGGCNLSQLRRAWEMTRAALSETVEA